MTFYKSSLYTLSFFLFAFLLSACSPKVNKSTTSTPQASLPAANQTNNVLMSAPVENEKLDIGNENPRSIPASTLPVERTQLIKK